MDRTLLESWLAEGLWLEQMGARAGRRHAAARRAGRLGRPGAGLPSSRPHRLPDPRLRREYRCLRCQSEQVIERRRRVRARLVAEAGGACVLCGYHRYIGALHFHHLDRATKSLALGGGATRSLERNRDEASKCVLLCSNRHAEVEAGLKVLP